MSAETQADRTAGHTAGPWCVMGDGVTVAQDKKHHRTHVCRAFEIYGVRKEREANARLIAASPEMYAAIRLALPIVEECERGWLGARMVGDAIRSALAAVEGAE